MTEKEVIERLYNFKSMSILYGNTYAMHIEQLKQLQEDLGTVLQLLEQKDKKIDELEKALIDEQLKYTNKINKAIDLLISEVKIYDQYYCLATSQALKTVLNELERLQKENEELKQDNSKQWKERCRLSFEVDDSIPKQVLRDKIKKLSDNKDFDGDVYVEEYAVDVLKELLGE